MKAKIKLKIKYEGPIFVNNEILIDYNTFSNDKAMRQYNIPCIILDFLDHFRLLNNNE